jgi:lipoate synthase
MSNYEDRPRYTEEEARRILAEGACAAIMHLLLNDDGTFSIMYHIVCEHCDYCDSQGDARRKKDIEAVPAKPDPYEFQER